MSVASKNLFDVLGDDGEPTPSLSNVNPELVKKTTSSKKGDAPPAKADPSRANPNRPRPTGNEAAYRDKNAGRENNRSRPAAEGETSKPRRGPTNTKDRRSQTGKADSSKKVKQGWGDDKKKQQDETAAESIAKADESAEDQEEGKPAAPVEEPDNTKTLDEYLAEIKEQTASLNIRSVRKPNEGVDDSKWKNAAELVREREEFVPSSKSKNLRSKNKKEKTVLETDITFAAPASTSGRDTRGRQGARGGRSDGPRGGRGGREGREGREARGPRGPRQSAPRQSAPTVNIGNQKEFPSLGTA